MGVDWAVEARTAASVLLGLNDIWNCGLSIDALASWGYRGRGCACFCSRFLRVG